MKGPEQKAAEDEEVERPLQEVGARSGNRGVGNAEDTAGEDNTSSFDNSTTSIVEGQGNVGFPFNTTAG